MPEMLPYLERIQKRFEDPNIQAALKGYTRIFQFEFTDSGESYYMKIEDGQKCTFENGKAPAADLILTSTTDVVIGVMERRINPVTAYTTRKVRVLGSMEDLLKLQRLL